MGPGNASRTFGTHVVVRTAHHGLAGLGDREGDEVLGGVGFEQDTKPVGRVDALGDSLPEHMGKAVIA